MWIIVVVIVVQSLSHVRLLATPWTAACQASLSIIISLNFLKLISIESWVSDAIQPFHPLLPPCLLPSIFPSIRVFSKESALRIRWPKYWSLGSSISPSNEYSGWFPLGWRGLFSLQSKGLARVFSSTTVRKCQFFGTQPSLWYIFHIHTWLLEKP